MPELMVILENPSIQHNIHIKIASSSLTPTKDLKLEATNLGVLIDDQLTFSDHVALVCHGALLYVLLDFFC